MKNCESYDVLLLSSGKYKVRTIVGLEEENWDKPEECTIKEYTQKVMYYSDLEEVFVGIRKAREEASAYYKKEKK